MRRQTAKQPIALGALVLALLVFLGLALTKFRMIDQLYDGGLQLWRDPFVVKVPGGVIRIPASDWKPMENEEAFVVNFEAKAKREGEAYPQVITVFKIPMSDPDRKGIETGRPSEYVEFFVVHPGKVTFTLRIDRGQYWLLSRQTFDGSSPEVPAHVAPDVQEYQPFLSKEQNRFFLVSFDLEVKRTRFTLQQLFSRDGS